MMNFSDLQREFKVYFDPDIDDFEQFSAHADNANAGNSSSMFYSVYGYDNSLEKDADFRNPVERVHSLKSLSDGDKKALIINLKTVCRKAIVEIGYRIIARQLFFAVNSLIDGKNEFKTIQQAYTYALSGEKANPFIIKAGEFLDVAKLYLYVKCMYRNGKNYAKFPALREIKILVNLCHNYGVRYDATTLESIFIDIDNNDYGYRSSFTGEPTTTNNKLSISSLFRTIDGHIIIDNNSLIDDSQNTGYLDDLYNNIRLRNVVKRAKNADKAYKTLEFQRFIGAEPTLLPAFGTIFCQTFAVYEMLYQNNGYIINDTSFNDILACIENDKSELNGFVSTIIKDNSVKAPDSSLNSEICSYVKTISDNKFERIRLYTLHKTDYYNGIALFLINKIKHYYDSSITQDAINTIAAIIHYYLHPLNKARNAILDKLDSKNSGNSCSLYGGRRNYVDSDKFSKIIESMVKNEDFCSYPIEFCVEKAKMLYFN